MQNLITGVIITFNRLITDHFIMLSQDIVECAFDIKNSNNYEKCEDVTKNIKLTSFDT